MTETDARSRGRRSASPRPRPQLHRAEKTAPATLPKAAKIARPTAPAAPDDPQAPATPARRTVPWSEIRSTYEESSLPVAVIAKAYGVRDRAIYERAAREGWAHRRGPQAEGDRPGPELARPELDRSVLVSRLFRAVERQIDEIDRHLAQLQSEGVDERDARTLAALAKTLELLIGLERQTRPEVVEQPEADIDAFRRDLARRIQSLQAAEGD
ncbi:MAG: hypothetical protein P4L82_16545 [Ancalomicrobiaceae bacterium]|nr:hypothetical protein [Ancalomicrobiaceae bacterium]